MLNFDSHENIRKYRHFYIPPKTIGDSPLYVVILSGDTELPFEEISIGEFFAQVEKQFPVWQNIDPLSAENYAAAQKNLARLKGKYRSKWNETARLELSRTDISLYDFVNATEDHEDFFDNGSGHTAFPVMKVKEEPLELCKTRGPQWLVIRWTMGMPNQAYNVHLHESILNNFNFDYVNNYFFHPENVKGKSYAPLRSRSFKEAVVQVKESQAASTAKADNNILYFEDFSTAAVGKKPTGWQAKLANGGTTALVTRPNNLAGTWVELKGHYISTVLKKQIPKNFTLTYDIAASQNFTWGAKGLAMQLSYTTTAGNVESYIMLRMRPGFDGRDGEATLETSFPSPPGYSNNTKWYKAIGFSNDKNVNLVTVTIKKKDETLQVFIGDTKIAEYEKAIPLAHPFNAISFDCSGNSAENDKYWISNIKITKD